MDEELGKNEELGETSTSPSSHSGKPVLLRLRLEQFKSFNELELNFGALTVLIGANATGKSNVKEALRFLHGISLGYGLNEIIGEKYGEAGFIQWRGIRGGPKELIFLDGDAFAIECDLDTLVYGQLNYRIEITRAWPGAMKFQVAREWLRYKDDRYGGLIEATAINSNQLQVLTRTSRPVSPSSSVSEPVTVSCHRNKPVITQLVDERAILPGATRHITGIFLDALKSLRFFDFVPESMRRPAFPGQSTLGDTGEYLPSVLAELCADPRGKHLLLSWLEELTPLDVCDLEFPEDVTGRLSLVLVEGEGRRTSSGSASDGTLRYIATVAATLHKHAQIGFFEEPEMGLHPSRLGLLINLLENQSSHRVGSQFILSTHSPLILQLLGPQSLEFVWLTYKLAGHVETAALKALSIPRLKQLLSDDHDSISELFAAGWMEQAVETVVQ